MQAEADGAVRAARLVINRTAGEVTVDDQG
jgi:hypothetical protein